MCHLCVARLSRAAVRLRTAAVEFAKLGPPKDVRDSIGLKANTRLLRAALTYAETVKSIKEP